MINRERLQTVFECLSTYDPKNAKKLGNLINFFDSEEDLKRKKEIGRRIYDFIYNIFCKLLRKDVAEKLYEYSCSINELCHEVEHHYGLRWLIDQKGAFMPRYNDKGEFIRYNEIPRSYLDGFKVDDSKPLDPEGVDFYLTNERRLDYISIYMDKKLELVTYSLAYKDARIPKELVDALVSFLGFIKLTPEEQVKKPKDGFLGL